MRMRPRSRAVVVISALALLVGLVSFGFVRGGATTIIAAESDMSWMQREFDLSDAQMAEIGAMHAAYRKICDGHCAMIRDGRARLAALKAGDADAATVARAAEALARHDAHCRSDLRDFVDRVAHVMGAEAGERYLALVEPRLAKFDHEGAPDLKWTGSHQHDATARNP